MNAGSPLLLLPCVPLWSACFELLKEMAPLEVNLPLGNRNPAGSRIRSNPRGVEPVSPLDRFGVHGPQILGNEGDRLGLFAKPQQLRMISIASGFTLQHRLGKQSLAP